MKNSFWRNNTETSHSSIISSAHQPDALCYVFGFTAPGQILPCPEILAWDRSVSLSVYEQGDVAPFYARTREIGGWNCTQSQQRNAGTAPSRHRNQQPIETPSRVGIELDANPHPNSQILPFVTGYSVNFDFNFHHLDHSKVVFIPVQPTRPLSGIISKSFYQSYRILFQVLNRKTRTRKLYFTRIVA